MRLASLCRGTSASLVLILFVVGLAAPAWADDSRPIDAHHSHMTVFVSKSGIFSRFAHDHEIAAPLAAGTVDAGARSVELRVESRTLRVLDPDLAERKRSEVQRTMLGPKVLDVERFPEIRFRSTAIEKTGQESWSVRGTLELHGQSRPVSLKVTRASESYRGSARLKQTDFGIKPVTVAGGTVRVKDEVRVEFEIALAR